MTRWRRITRRRFVQAGALLAAGSVSSDRLFGGRLFRAQLPGERLPGDALLAGGLDGSTPVVSPLDEFGYGDVSLADGLQESQLNASLSVVMGLSDDALLKPFRAMAGKAAPGPDLGGWYRYDPNYQPGRDEAGFAPAHCFGQWVSAMARSYAITKSPETRERVLRLNRLYAEAISEDYFEKTRFPAYSYDKLVLGLIDSHEFVGDPDAFSILERTTSLALPRMPERAVTREKIWRQGKDVSYTWDESYTLPENLLLAYKRGAGGRYRELAGNYLEDETYFDPLARGEDPMAGRHAYSYVNALSSGMQAYLTLGSEKHLRAAKHGFDLLAAQSFSTGGWGPDEQLRPPGSDELFASLTKTHNSFETPCGSYAHFKLTRYLLRVTREARYGDSMERVMHNTVLGVKPLEPDGQAFYYSDYNFKGKRVYSDHRWPCCAGTLPQVAADYRISAYFRDGRDVYVNLYLPSTLRWTQDGRPISLTQEGDYPFEETVRMKVAVAHGEKFALLLRIPAWAEGASVSINGKAVPGAIGTGSFLRIDRKWKSGDQVALNLPMILRLEAINSRHPETVALMRGPLALLALGERPPTLARKDLLAAKRVERSQWVAESAGGAVKFVSFPGVGSEGYSAYVTTDGASV